jgi:hypothetical protein
MHNSVGIIQPAHRTFSLVRNQNRIDEDIDAGAGQADGYRQEKSHNPLEMRIMPVEIKMITGIL